MNASSSTKLFLALSPLLLAASLTAAPTPTTISNIVAAPNAIAVGASSTVTVTLQDATGPISCGTGTIRYKVTHPDTTVTAWTDLGSSTPSANVFSRVFDTNAVSVAAGDVVTLESQFTPGGCPGGSFSGVGYGNSPTTQILIVASESPLCPNGQTTGVFVSIAGPGGLGNPPPGYVGTWSFTVNVRACADVFDVTAQGGANGWANLKSYLQSAGSVGTLVKNKNTIYQWNIGNMTAGSDATLTIYTGATLKNGAGECGKVKLLNGDWSAQSASFSGGPKTKSDYTQFTSTITTTCP